MTTRSTVCSYDLLHQHLRADLVQDERIFKSGLLDVLVPVRGTEVARAHVRLEQQRVGVGLGRAQLGAPLGGLPVGHARVIEASGDEHRGVRLGLHVVVGGVLEHVVVELLLVGIA